MEASVTCSTASVSDRAKPAVDFACAAAIRKADIKEFSSVRDPFVPNNFFIAAAWQQAGVTLTGMAYPQSFYGNLAGGVRKPFKDAAPGDVLFIDSTPKFSYGVDLGDRMAAGLDRKTRKIELLKVSGSPEAITPA
ncbi:hypothetical protein [Streptomyces sp. NPDC056492]|uniref:hypothetical protein n=1 Tax=unclassified Streptomyces TaxID=2593676 RepID=UPI0036859654